MAKSCGVQMIIMIIIITIIIIWMKVICAHISIIQLEQAF